MDEQNILVGRGARGDKIGRRSNIVHQQTIMNALVLFGGITRANGNMTDQMLSFLMLHRIPAEQRKDPGLQGQRLKYLPEGTVMKVIDGPKDVDQLKWWKLQSRTDANDLGWAAADYLQVTSP